MGLCLQIQSFLIHILDLFVFLHLRIVVIQNMPNIMLVYVVMGAAIFDFRMEELVIPHEFLDLGGIQFKDIVRDPVSLGTL